MTTSTLYFLASVVRIEGGTFSMFQSSLSIYSLTQQNLHIVALCQYAGFSQSLIPDTYSLARNLLLIPSLPPSLTLSVPRKLSKWTEFISRLHPNLTGTYLGDKGKSNSQLNGHEKTKIKKLKNANQKYWSHNPNIAGHGPVRNNPKFPRHISMEI